MECPPVVLKPKEELRLQGGHLWAFSNEIAEAPQGLPPGSLADLFHSHNGFIGRGFYHPHSLIAFRVLSNQKEDIDARFFEKRFEDAMAWRERCYPGQKAYRWVFGESDRLPGLVVDRYADYLSVQIVSAGMELFKDMIFAALIKVANPKGIVWRSDAMLRELDGLEIGAPKVVHGKIPERIEFVTENGLFEADLLKGQKTGFYFDQRENRQRLAAFCEGKRVLDAFCYSGGFGIAAGLAGAKEVVFLDSAQAALELAQSNVDRNGLGDRATVVEGDALQLLVKAPPGGPFDVISIDPPAYARSKKHLPVALKAYEKLNGLAMSALPRGGLLATSSCSHHVSREIFIEMLRRSARKSRRTFRMVELRSQAKDHPVLLNMPETEYLKFALLQVL